MNAICQHNRLISYEGGKEEILSGVIYSGNSEYRVRIVYTQYDIQLK